jgi:hypothetical protein
MRASVAAVILSSGLAAASTLNHAVAADVSVAVNVNVPGVYGQIALGELPPPELILPRPVVAVPARVVMAGPPPEPLYLHVPPGHEKHWEKHCREYNACGRPVYFVSHRWYQDVYAPRHESRRVEHYEEHDHGHGHGHDHGHGQDHDRD